MMDPYARAWFHMEVAKRRMMYSFNQALKDHFQPCLETLFADRPLWLHFR